MKTSKIKEWSPADRPREKLLQSGPSALGEAELLAILLRNGTREHTAIDLARLLLASCNHDLQELARAGQSQLSGIKGVGQVKALTVVAALELGRRCRLAEAKQKERIGCSLDAVHLLDPVLRDLPHEEFWIILLNRANAVMDLRPISKGGISGTVVDPKMIFHEALHIRASGIILGHNHPSANPKPSESDVQLTKKLKEGGKLLEISVLDHIIIAGSSFYSFADEGTL
ncbi:MAG: DNA repair protein RadC [Bacteroidia bacterium]|nr:DNA repair protein RadC [Bacteroidia bacterium]